MITWKYASALTLFFISITMTSNASAKSESNALEIYAIVPVGSIHDTFPGEAHLVEHLKFKASSPHSYAAYEAIPGTTYNAQTSFYLTLYRFQAPHDALEAVLETYSELPGPLAVTRQNFEHEREIVMQEILEGTRAQPENEAYEAFFSRLYEDTVYSHWPIGTIEALEAAKLQDVARWNDEHYANADGLIVIAGDLDRKKTEDRARAVLRSKRFAIVAIDTGNPPLKPDPSLARHKPLIPQEGIEIASRKSFEMEVPAAHLQSPQLNWTRLYKARGEGNEEIAARGLLLGAMQSRLTEGLHDRIAETDRIVRGWSVALEWVAPGYWELAFTASLATGATPDEVKAAFDTYLVQLADTGISRESFARLKERMLRRAQRRWHYPREAAFDFAMMTASYGYDFAVRWPEEIETMTLEDTTRLLRSLAEPVRDGTLILRPTEDSR